MITLIRKIALSMLKGYLIDQITKYVKKTSNPYDDQVVKALEDYFES